MKKSLFSFFLVVVVLCLQSCDPSSGAIYKVRNASDSIVTIEFKEGIHYMKHTGDTVIAVSTTEGTYAILHRQEHLVVEYLIRDTKVPSHTPLWENIVSISIGNQILSKEDWFGEKNWQTEKSGGHAFSFGEEWNFELILENK
ncbi:MAG: hypothetical protein IKQ58_02055 [Prevotella sp.]|nr:hypothetical protein [Prevotella sp.]